MLGHLEALEHPAHAHPNLAFTLSTAVPVETSGDLVFTAAVVRDRELPTFRDPAGIVEIRPDGAYRSIRAPFDTEILEFLALPIATKLVEQGRLQGPRRDQLLDGGGPKRRDPLQARHRFELVTNAGLREESPVPHQDDPRQSKVLPQFVNLRGQGPGVSRIALKDLDRHGTALAVA